MNLTHQLYDYNLKSGACFFNNEIVGKSYSHKTTWEPYVDFFSIDLDLEIIDEFDGYKLKDFPHNVREIRILHDFDEQMLNWFDKSCWISLKMRKTMSLSPYETDEDHNPSMTATLSFNLNNWHNPYTVKEYATEFINYSRRDQDKSSQGTPYTGPAEYLTILVISTDLYMDEELKVSYNRIINLIHKTHEAVNESLGSKTFQESVATQFSFPEHINEVCVQYLAYFTKFLSDLGIETESTIVTQASNVLFTIFPLDENQALEQIREALTIYLNMPGVTELESLAYEFSDVSVKQLAATVYHLKSQLLLINAELELKNATIETLKLSNYQLTLSNKESETKNEESLFGGVVKIDELEWKGIKINWAEIFRKLKRNNKRSKGD